MSNQLAFVQTDPLVVLVPGSVLRRQGRLYKVTEIGTQGADPSFCLEGLGPGVAVSRGWWAWFAGFELTWGYDSVGNKLNNGDRIRHPDGRTKVISLGPPASGPHLPWPGEWSWEEIVRDGWVLSPKLRFQDLKMDDCFRFTANDAKRRKLSAESWYNYEEGKLMVVRDAMYGLDSEVELL